MMRVLLILVGYVFGLFQTGYLYGKAKGIDIRTKGSGNAGATNTLRVFGLKASAIVFLGDALKLIIPCMACFFIFRTKAPELTYVYMMYTAFGVVAGHNFPFYLGFKGGKGISCTAGLILCLEPVYALCLFCVFGLVVYVTRYVSLGSLICVFLGVILVCFRAASGVYGLSDAVVVEFCLLVFLWGVLAFWQHRANIKRLIAGNENKIRLHSGQE